MLKKMIVPVIVTVLFCLYMGFFGFTALLTPSPILFKIIFGGLPLLATFAMLYVAYERYKELKGGYEDDISNY